MIKGVFVLFLQSVAVGGKAFDQGRKLAHKKIGVVGHQLGPHGGVQPCHARQIPIAARRKAVVGLCRFAFDIGVRNDMAKLGGKGYGLIVGIFVGKDDLAEAKRKKKIFQPLVFVNIGMLMFKC